jgi:hypothetical protein
MRRLAILLALVWAAPAHASWSLSAPYAPAGTSLRSAVVAPDGTVLSTWSGKDYRPRVRVGHGQPVTLPGRFADLPLVATRRGAYVGWTSGDTAMLARATRGGLLGNPERIGSGDVLGLATNDRADLAAALERPGTETALAFRPAGGRFRTLAFPPTNSYPSVALSPERETLAIQNAPLESPAPNSHAVDVIARAPTGEASTARLTPPPSTIPTPGPGHALQLAIPTQPVLTTDGQGRVLAAWLSLFGDHVYTAVRDASGRWSEPVDQLLTSTTFLPEAVATRDGRAIVTLTGSGTVSVMTGTLASAQFSAPQVLAQGAPTSADARALRDGSFVVSYTDDDGLFLLRAEPDQTFGPPELVADDDPGTYGAGIAGVLRDGRLVLWAGDRLLRETRR